MDRRFSCRRGGTARVVGQIVIGLRFGIYRTILSGKSFNSVDFNSGFLYFRLQQFHFYCNIWVWKRSLAMLKTINCGNQAVVFTT